MPQTVLQLELTRTARGSQGRCGRTTASRIPSAAGQSCSPCCNGCCPSLAELPRRSKVHETPKPAQSHQEDVPVSTTSGKPSPRALRPITHRALLPDEDLGDRHQDPRHRQRRLHRLWRRPQGSTSDAVKFPRGSFKVNPATCFFTFTGGGKFTVSGGTGAYRGISGSGKVVLSIVGILGSTKIGACSQNGKPVAWQQTYPGTARIKL
jgi:hypothetical protein